MMSQGGTLSETHLPVRWVVMFTGSKATDDYKPSASADESPALVGEVTDLCVAFHPESDVRLFPQESEVLLFWQTRTTGEWVVTRVSVAPNPKGLRTALEYCSLVFSDSEFVKIGRNPFRTRELKLHEKVRQQFLEQQTSAVDLDLSELTAVVYPGRTGEGSTSELQPDLSPDLLSTAENFRELKAYCNRAEEAGETPRTFASWWSTARQMPANTFDIVLRPVPPKPLSLHGVLADIKAVSTQTKESLPNAPADDAIALDLSRGILTKVDALVSGLNAVASRTDMYTVPEFQMEMRAVAQQADALGSDVDSFRSRLTTSGSQRESELLSELAAEYRRLSNEIGRVPHPDPFASHKTQAGGKSQKPVPKAAASGLDAAGRSQPSSRSGNARGANPVVLVLVTLAVLAAVGAAFIMQPGDSKKKTAPGGAGKAPANSGKAPANPPKSTKPAGNAAAKPANPTAKPAAGAISVRAVLTEAREEILRSAKPKAQEQARQEALNAGELSGAQLDQITYEALQTAYKAKLTRAEYQKAFESGEGWDYARFRQLLPTLTEAVRGGAELGAINGAREREEKLESKRQAQREAQREAQQAREQAAQREKERERQREREPRRTTTARATPKPEPPKPATPKPAEKKPAEGSARKLDL